MLGRKLFSPSLVLGLVVSFAFPAHAELLKNFKTDGSIEARTFGIDNETDRNSNTDDYRSDMRTRLMVGGSFDLLDDVHSRVLLRKNNRLNGQNSSGVAPAGASSENLNQVQTAIAVDNAYVKIDKVFDYVDLTMGRQFYGNSDDTVIYLGPNNDDILSVNALDAFRADADIKGWAKFQGIAGKLSETTGLSGTNPPAPSNVNSDTDIWGAQLGTDKVIPKGNLSAAYYTRTIKGPGVLGNNTVNVAQLAALGDLMITGLSYQAEVDQNFGRNNTVSGTGGNLPYTGTAYLLGLKYGQDMNGKPIRAHGEYGRGTDNFAAISPGKRFGLIWGEHTTVGPSTINRGANGFATGLSNLKVFDIGGGISPIAKLGIDVAWYRFMYDAYTAGFNTSAGSEYDLIVSWKHSDNVYLEANAASFQVGQALANPSPTGTSPITRLGADVKIKF